MDSFRNLEDETFPSFLSNASLANSGTLANVTLGSNFGVPVAASTVAKIRATADNRWETPICVYFIVAVCNVRLYPDMWSLNSTISCFAICVFC